jgi:hypothetical protein
MHLFFKHGMNMNNNIFQRIFGTVLLLLAVLVGNAQIKKAVTSTITVAPPYTPYFSDLYEAGSTKLLSTITLNDFNEPSWDVKLRLTIQSDAVIVANPVGFTPLNSINLTPGVPVTFSGDSWTEYLDYNNLQVSGMDKASFVSKGVLPEGLYTFKLEVLDYNSGILLGNPAQFSCYISLGGIPQLISPKDEYMVPNDPQNIVFQWQLSSPSVDPLSTEYQLVMYEVTSKDVQPEAALANNNVLKVFESEWSTTPMLVYDASMPTLETDKNYTYTIQVRDNKRENIFRNNGMSEAYWFSYGYPTGGEILTTLPEDKSAFKKGQRKEFKWKAPNNMQQGQKVSYHFKMVKMQENQDAEKAMVENAAFYEESFENTMSPNGWEMVLGEYIQPDTWYGWQITATTGTQEIAKSKVMTVKGPPLLQWFKAADQQVEVLTMDNADLNNLSGTCEIKLDKDGEKTVEARFEGIKIIKAGDIHLLKAGEIKVDEAVLQPIDIKEINNVENTAQWVNTGLRLTADRLEVKGYIESLTPFAVDGSDAGKFVSQDAYLTFNNFHLNGQLQFDPNKNQFDLLDPMGFRYEFNEKSYYLLANNQYSLVYTGKIGLPESLLSKAGPRLYIPFNELKQLEYFTCNAIKDELDYPQYQLLNNCNINIEPVEVVFDFSEEKSPLKISEKDWKGAFVRKYNMVYEGQLDNQGQLTMREPYKKGVTISSVGNDVNWITSTGLQFFRSEDFTRVKDVLFNKFPAEFKEFFVQIEAGRYKDGNAEGTIMIPVVSNTRKFGFTMPINNDGFQIGYLHEKLDNQSFSFNVDGGENRADVTIKRAVFADNERLDMTLDISVPGIKAKMENISGFKAYGDYYIGMQKRNGSIELGKQVEAEYQGYQMYLDTIGFVFKRGTYSFIYGGSIPLGPEMSGKDGPPRVNIISVAKLGNKFKDVVEKEYFSTAYQPTIDIPVATLSRINRDKPRDLQVREVYVELESTLATMKGNLVFEKNNPEYGTILKGKMDGFIYAPTKIEIESNILYGTKNKTDFWYFDAYYFDEYGPGTNIGMVNLVALEGRVYRHMRPTGKAKPGSQVPEVVIDPKMDFGMAAYLQLVDAETMGEKVLMDLATTVKVAEGDFEVKFKGEGSFLNSAGRSKAAIAEAAKKVSEALDADPMAAVIEQINKLELDVDPLTVAPFVETDLSKAGLRVKADGHQVDAYANFNNITAGAYYTNGDISGTVEGAPTGGLVEFSNPDFGMKAGYTSGGGTLGFNSGAYRLEGSFVPKGKKGEFGLQTPDFGLDINADAKSKKGGFNLEIGSTTRMYVDATSDGAGMGFYYDNTKIDLSGSKSGTAKMNVFVDDQGMGIGFNKATKEGFFEMAMGDDMYKVNASKTNGQIILKQDDFAFDIGFNKSDKAGWLSLQESDRNYQIAIDQAKNTGKIFFANGDQRFGIGASQKQGAGFFDYQNGPNKLFVEANKSAKTGQFNLSLDGLKMAAGLNTDSLYMDFKVDGVEYEATKINNGLGYISMKKGNSLMALRGNKEGEGYMTLGYGNTLFDLGVNKKSGDGHAKVQLGKDYFDLKLDNTNTTGLIATQLGSDVFNAEYSEKHGSVMLKNSDNTILLSGGDNQGEFLYEYGKNLYNIRFNSAETVGGLRLVQGKDSINLALNADDNTAHLFTAFNGNYVGSELLSDGSGKLITDDGKTRLELLGSNNGRSGFLLKGNEQHFAINANAKEQTGDIQLKFDEFEIEGDLAGKVGAANIVTTFKGTKLGASVNENGGGSLLLQNGKMDFKVSQNNPNHGRLLFSDNHLHFNIEGDKTKGGLWALGMGSDSIVSQLDLKEQWSSVNAYVAGNQLAVLAGANGWGEVSILQGNKRMRIAGDAAGSGELELAQAGNYILLGADKSNRSGKLTLAQNQDSLISWVNANNNTGLFKMVDGNNFITINKQKATQNISFSLDGNALDLGQTETGGGYLKIKNSDLTLDLVSEPQSKALNLAVGGYTIETAQENTAAQAKVKYDNQTLTLEKKGEQQYKFMATDGDKELQLQQKESNNYLAAYNDAVYNLALETNTAENTVFFKAQNSSLAFDISKGKDTNAVNLALSDVNLGILYAASHKGMHVKKGKSSIGYVRHGDIKTISLEHENYKVKVDNEYNTTIVIDDKNIEVKGRKKASDPLTIVYNGETQEIPLDAKGMAHKVINPTFSVDNGITHIALDENNSIKINLSKLSVELVSNMAGDKILLVASKKGADFTYGNYEVKVNDKDGVYVSDNNQMRLKVSKKELDVQLNENKVYWAGSTNWKLQVPEKEASLQNNKLYLKNFDQYLAIDQGSKEYKIFLEENLQYSLSGDSSFVAVAQQRFSASPRGISYAGNQVDATVSKEKVSYNDNNHHLLVSKNQARLKVGSTVNIALHENKIDALFNDYQAKVTPGESYYFSDGDRTFDSNQEQVLQLGDYAVKANKGGIVQLAKGENTITASRKSINASWEDYTVAFGADTSLYFAHKDLTVDLTQEELSLTEKNNSVAYNAKNNTVKVSAGSDKNIAASPKGMELQWENIQTAFGTGKNLSFADGKRSFEVKNGEQLDMDIEGNQIAYNLKDQKLSYANGTNKKVNVSLSSFELQWNDVEAGITADKNIRFKDNSREFTITPEELYLASDDKKVSYKANKSISVAYGDELFAVSPEGIEIKYENYQIGIDKTQGMRFTDGERTLTSEDEKLAFKIGDIGELAYYLKEERIAYTHDRTHNISAANDAFSIQLGQSKFAVGAEVGISYQDPDRSFEYGENLIMKEQDTKLAIENINSANKKYLVAQGDYEMAFSQDNGFSLSDGSSSFAVGGKEDAFAVKTGGKEFKYSESKGAQMSEGKVKVIFGGDTYYALFEHSGHGIAATKEMSYLYYDKDNRFELTKEMGLRMNVKDYHFTVNSNDTAFCYDDSQNLAFINVDKNQPDKAKLMVDIYGFEVDIDNKGKAPIMKVGYQGTAVTIDAGNNWFATVQSGSDAHSIYRSDMFGVGYVNDVYSPEVLTAEMPESKVNLEGPSYIGKITEDGDGIIKALLEGSYSSNTGIFYLHGAANANNYVCFENVDFEAEFGSDKWYVQVGQPEGKWMSIEPLCMGVSVEGYFRLDQDKMEMGFGHSFKVKGSASVGIASVESGFGYYYKAGLKIKFSPAFEMMGSVEAGASAWVKVCAPVVGCTKLASVSMKGKLSAIIGDKIYLSGSVSGKVKVAGVIDQSVSVDISTTL